MIIPDYMTCRGAFESDGVCHEVPLATVRMIAPELGCAHEISVLVGVWDLGPNVDCLLGNQTFAQNPEIRDIVIRRTVSQHGHPNPSLPLGRPEIGGVRGLTGSRSPAKSRTVMRSAADGGALSGTQASGSTGGRTDSDDGTAVDGHNPDRLPMCDMVIDSAQMTETQSGSSDADPAGETNGHKGEQTNGTQLVTPEQTDQSDRNATELCALVETRSKTAKHPSGATESEILDDTLLEWEDDMGPGGDSSGNLSLIHI